MRQETLACLTTEDELSSTLRILEAMNKAKGLYTHYAELAVKQQFMEEEDKEISRQLAMSKPLVTEMLEFLNTKSSQGEATSEMRQLIIDVQ